MVRKREKQGVKPSTQMEVKRVNRRVARTRCSRDEGARRADRGGREEAAVDAGLSREEGKDKKEAEDLGGSRDLGWLSGPDTERTRNRTALATEVVPFCPRRG